MHRGSMIEEEKSVFGHCCVYTDKCKNKRDPRSIRGEFEVNCSLGGVWILSRSLVAEMDCRRRTRYNEVI